MRNSVRNRNGRGRRFMILALKVTVNVANSGMGSKGKKGWDGKRHCEF